MGERSGGLVGGGEGEKEHHVHVDFPGQVSSSELVKKKWIFQGRSRKKSWIFHNRSWFLTLLGISKGYTASTGV